MALIFGDGFDHYSTSMKLNKWDSLDPNNFASQFATIGSSFGRLGSQGVSTGGGLYSLGKNLPAANSGYGYVGAAFYIPSYTAFRKFLFVFTDPAGETTVGTMNAQVLVALEADGSISARYGRPSLGTSLLAVGSPGQIAAGTWYYIEAKVKVHNTSGSVDVRVNGVSALSISGVNTRRSTANNYFTQIGIGGGDFSGGASQTGYFDDFYYCDDTGSFNNTWLGDVQLQAIYPDGAGNSTQWTPNTGANWAAVDDTTPDDDTTYVASATVNQLDMYTMQNVSSTAADVKGLLINCRVKKDDATARTYSTMVKDVSSAGSNTAVATRTTPFGNYTNQQDVSETSPATSTYWTVTQVNALEAGIKVIS